MFSEGERKTVHPRSGVVLSISEELTSEEPTFSKSTFSKSTFEKPT